MKGDLFAGLLASLVAHAAIIAALPLAMETSAGEDGSSAEIRLLGLVEMAAASETPVPSAPAAPGDSERSRGAAEARSRYLAGVLRRIHAAKRYPQRARRNRIEGRVAVTFTIGADGSVSASSLSSSSGDDLLDAEALRIVDRAAPHAPGGGAGGGVAAAGSADPPVVGSSGSCFFQ